MEASTLTTSAVAIRPVLFSPEEELALVGFPAGYRGLTRDAYAFDLCQYVAWCTERNITLFGARRADIESFGRHLETLGRHAPRSLAGCAPSLRSTATPKKRT